MLAARWRFRAAPSARISSPPRRLTSTVMFPENWPRPIPAAAGRRSRRSISSPAPTFPRAGGRRSNPRRSTNWSGNRSTTIQICRAAEAAIKVAQYNALAQRGLFFPQVTGNSTSADHLIANRRQVPRSSDSGPQTQYTLVTNQLTVTFVPDIWGANFRAVENLDAVTEQQLFQLEAAYLALTSNVVTAAIQEASLRGQIAATQRIIAIERNLLDILKRQFSFGQAAQADVLAQEAALAQAEQLLPPLEKQLAQQRDLLTALAGQLSADEIEQKFDLAHLKLPANLPVSLPSKLVDQRPDVRAAEANMHSASALVGVAIAARLPNIVLSANGGSTAYNFAQSFTPGTGFYTLAASATAPIFDGFTLYNKQKAAEAALGSGRGPVSRHRHHRIPERGGRLARPAVGRARDEGGPACGRHRQGQPRHRPEAVERRAGQSARRPQCAADLPDGRRSPACRPRPIASPIPPRCSWRSAAAGRPTARRRFGGNVRWTRIRFRSLSRPQSSWRRSTRSALRRTDSRFTKRRRRRAATGAARRGRDTSRSGRRRDPWAR